MSEEDKRNKEIVPEDKIYLEIRKSHDLYNSYKKIHSDVIRMLPKLKFIKYRDHDNELGRILNEIKKSQFKISHYYKTDKHIKEALSEEIWHLFRAYFREFWKMINSLKSIVERLADQAEGKSKFPIREYKPMLNKFCEEFDTFHAVREKTYNFFTEMEEGFQKLLKKLDKYPENAVFEDDEIKKMVDDIFEE